MKQLLLVAVVLAIASAEIIPFDQAAIEMIFTNKQTALFLFTTTGEDSIAALAAFRQLDETYPQGLLLVHSDTDDGHGLCTRLAEYLGVDVSTFPTVVFLGSDGNKYVLEDQYTAENLKEFIGKAEAKEIDPFLKSAPIPESNDEPVKILVGKTFKDYVINSEKEVLVKFYAPWCGHCKTLAPEFDMAAARLANNPNILLAKVDSTLNEVAGVIIEGYPTLKWWGKDKSQESIDYNGGRDAEGLISWIRDHTQYPWVEEEAAGTDEEPAAETQAGEDL